MTLSIKGLFATVSIMTFSIMTLSLVALCHYIEYCCAQCHILFTVMLGVVMLNVIMLSVTFYSLLF
jgi:hypothetical protein